MKTIRPLVLLASKRNICGQDRSIRFICCRENGQYSVNRGLNVHVRVHYDQEAAGGRQTCQVCRRCLLRGPSPSPSYSCTAFPSPQNRSLLLWNIFSWRRLSILVSREFHSERYRLGRCWRVLSVMFVYLWCDPCGLWRMEWFMEYREGVY